jgi:hypothetical protein
LDQFDTSLCTPAADVEIELRGLTAAPWADFFLNPRRLRGSDFLMRWSQGQWSEERLIQAVDDTQKYFALPYGPSGTAPDDDIRAFEMYFERLEAAGLGRVKRPDLLLFRSADRATVDKTVNLIGGLGELPFTPEDDPRLKKILERAFLAIECENSLWKAGMMPDYGKELTPQRRLAGRSGLKKSAVVPTVILKEEDRKPLLGWECEQKIRVHIWHVFYDMALGIALSEVERLVQTGLIEPTEQVFQAPGGATTKKIIYKIYYHYAYRLGSAQSEPSLVADSITDKNGHILPYVRFHGGVLQASEDAMGVLDSLSKGS